MWKDTAQPRVREAGATGAEALPRLGDTEAGGNQKWLGSASHQGTRNGNGSAICLSSASAQNGDISHTFKDEVWHLHDCAADSLLEKVSSRKLTKILQDGVLNRNTWMVGYRLVSIRGNRGCIPARVHSEMVVHLIDWFPH